MKLTSHWFALLILRIFMITFDLSILNEMGKIPQNDMKFTVYQTIQ